MRVANPAKFNAIVVWVGIVYLTIALPCVSVAQEKPFTPTANKEAEIAFKQGLEAFQKGDFKAATESFTTAIKLDEKFAEAYYYRGRVRDEAPWFEREFDNRGLHDYDSVIKLNPNFADAYLRRGMSRDYGDKTAIDDFTAAIRIKPDFAEAYYQRAITQADEALRDLRWIHSKEFEESNLRFHDILGMKVQTVGQAMARLTRQFRVSVLDLIKATDLNPRYVEAHSYLAIL